MANNVNSTIRVKGTKELIDKINEMFAHKIGKDSEWFARTIYDEYESSSDWMAKHIGPKWIYSDYAGKEGDEEFEIQTVSAWEFPKEYLKKLLEIILAIDDSATVECTYQDEIPKFVGAFYGTKNGNDYKQEVPDDGPDEDDFEDDEGDIDDVAYDEAVENYEYELDDLCQKLLDELKK